MIICKTAIKPLLVENRPGTGETTEKKQLVPTFQRSPLWGKKKERKPDQNIIIPCHVALQLAIC